VRWIGCIAALVSGLLAGVVGGWDLAERTSQSIPLFTIVGGVATSVAAAIPSCREPCDSPKNRRMRVYREVAFIGVLSPIVLGTIVPVGSLADVVYWTGTVLWIVAVLLLYSDFFVGSAQEGATSDPTRLANA
jgi:hypothetical protein